MLAGLRGSRAEGNAAKDKNTDEAIHSGVGRRVEPYWRAKSRVRTEQRPATLFDTGNGSVVQYARPGAPDSAILSAIHEIQEYSHLDRRHDDPERHRPACIAPSLSFLGFDTRNFRAIVVFHGVRCAGQPSIE
jgi:hypothetical protein